MKAVAFDYLRPATVAEACAALSADAGACVLAGGQTLIPLLAMRLARPTLLIDVARIPELSGIRDCDSCLSIAAATTQAAAERNPLVRARLPLLAKALPWVGHAATRHRGTIGGSIATGYPGAEIPLVAVALQATVALASTAAARTMAIGEFFLGPMVTALPSEALLLAVHFPVWSQRRVGAAFHEVAARAGDFALVACAAQVACDEEGRCSALTAAIGGVGDRPVVLSELATLLGTPLEEGSVRAAVLAATADLEALDDLHASAAYRRRVAATLARRAILDAKAEALGGAHAR
jgi:CO/xanthine dehydrogenase FAD-binding subunit